MPQNQEPTWWPTWNDVPVGTSAIARYTERPIWRKTYDGFVEDKDGPLKRWHLSMGNPPFVGPYDAYPDTPEENWSQSNIDAARQSIQRSRDLDVAGIAMNALDEIERLQAIIRNSQT